MHHGLDHTTIRARVLLSVFAFGYGSDNHVLSGFIIGSKGFLVDNSVNRVQVLRIAGCLRVIFVIRGQNQGLLILLLFNVRLRSLLQSRDCIVIFKLTGQFRCFHLNTLNIELLLQNLEFFKHVFVVLFQLIIHFGPFNEKIF